MNTLFEYAEACLFDADIASKIQLTHQAQHLSESGQLIFESIDPPKPIATTQFPEKPLLLMPRDMPRRRLDTPAGKAAFFHALAHIEFMAIYLAWDIVYRFQGLPEKSVDLIQRPIPK